MRICSKSACGTTGTRTPWNTFAVVAVLLLSASTALAAPLTNGNFEAATNADNLTNTFPNWTESTSPTSSTTGNVAVRATTALAGSTSARLTGSSGQVGTLGQSVTPIFGTFDFTFSFAAVDPGGVGTNFRSMQLLLTGSNSGQINLIVTRGSTTSLGSVQVYSSTASAFQSITSEVDRVNFSTSLTDPVVNTIRLAGTVGGSYTISTNGSTSGPVSFYQGTSNPANFQTVNFTTANATTVNYVVDNVTLIPEPATAGLLTVAATLLLGRRRCRPRIG